MGPNRRVIVAAAFGALAAKMKEMKQVNKRTKHAGDQ